MAIGPLNAFLSDEVMDLLERIESKLDRVLRVLLPVEAFEDFGEDEPNG